MLKHEQRYRRDGVPVPIQCLWMQQNRVRSEVSFHYHDYIELLFGVEGRARAHVGTRCYDLEPDTMIIVRNNELHDVLGTGEKSRYIVVKFLPSVLSAEEQTFSEYTYALLMMQNMHSGKTYFRADELSNTPIPALFLQMIEEWEAQKFGYELGLRAGAMTIVLHIMRKWQEENPSIAEISITASQRQLIQNAITYIEKHYADLTEEECARALSVSAAYLSRVFKKGMKTSFTSYVNGVKIKEAEKLLHESDLSMTEIAEKVGFSTVAYFIATFRERYRLTPNQYRKFLHGNTEASI